MPTYDYVCDGCHYTFEEFQSMKDDALKDCPQCKQPQLRRLFGTGAAILFKGSGFYETDYRSESYKSAAKADQPAAKADGKADGKSDSAGSNGTAAPAPAAAETKSPKSTT